MREYEVWDDTRDFFDLKLRTKTAGYFFDYKDNRQRDSNQLHCDASLLDNPLQRSCIPFMKMTLDSSGEKQITVRTYPKFFGTLGEIGGTAELIFLFVGLFYFKYNEYYLRKFIKSEEFKIESATGLKTIFPNTNKQGAAKNNKFGKILPQGYQSPHNGPTSTSQKVMMKEEEVKIEGLDETPSRNSTTKSSIPKRRVTFKTEESHLEELIEEQIEQNMNGISLCRSLNQLEILLTIFFKARHKKLLPVILLNLLKKKPKNQAKKSNGDRSQGHDLRGLSKEDPKEENMTMEQAYDQLNNTRPENEIEKIMDDFFLDNAPKYFKDRQAAKAPHPPPDPKWKIMKVVNMEPSQSSEHSQPSQHDQTDQFELETIQIEESRLKSPDEFLPAELSENSFKSNSQSIPGRRGPPQPLNSDKMNQGAGEEADAWQGIFTNHLGSDHNLRKRMKPRRSQFLKHKKQRSPVGGRKKQGILNRPQNINQRKISASQLKANHYPPIN